MKNDSNILQIKNSYNFSNALKKNSVSRSRISSCKIIGSKSS